MKKAILYVKAGEFDDQASIECVFEYPNNMDYESLEKAVGQHIKQKVDSFEQLLQATFPCAYDIFFNNHNPDFATLQKLVTEAGLREVLRPNKQDSNVKKIFGSCPSSCCSWRVSNTVTTNNSEGLQNSEGSEGSSQEEGSSDESDEDSEGSLDDERYKKYWSTEEKEYIRILKECIKKDEVKGCEVSNFLLTSHSNNSYESNYTYSASLHLLDECKVYNLCNEY